jgi:hypothetical protein
VGFQEISLYRFTCDGDLCRLNPDGPTRSPAMPGQDPGEAASQIAPLGWYVVVAPGTGVGIDFDNILCPSCAADETQRAEAAFNREHGYKNAADEPDDPGYDPDERRLWNKLTPAERRSLHPSLLGRMATVEDARRLLAQREES